MSIDKLEGRHLEVAIEANDRIKALIASKVLEIVQETNDE